jgi:hypothetical protein
VFDISHFIYWSRATRYRLSTGANEKLQLTALIGAFKDAVELQSKWLSFSIYHLAGLLDASFPSLCFLVIVQYVVIPILNILAVSGSKCYVSVAPGVPIRILLTFPCRPPRTIMC